ncbi:RimK family protein [Gynuella sp.]|uniref:RimK family protein n=1 Tax=Gynuella sp. TaxID=2969146 RepID=UPI003D0CEBAF
MKSLLILVDQLSDWTPFYQDRHVTEINDYLAAPMPGIGYVINLCRDFSYQSSGYYGSLLAEARGELPFPSVRSITEFHNYEKGNVLERKYGKLLENYANDHQFELEIFFGKSAIKELNALTRHLFERFRFPALRTHFKRLSKHIWSLEDVSIISIDQLDDHQQTLFADALDIFSRKVWRKSSSRKYQYDLAILVNPDEQLPPSNQGALKLFEKAAKETGLDVDFITTRDADRIPQYDALFIRETTSVTHDTYRCAQIAERNNLVVIDSPSAILTCANKVYLHEVLTRNKVPTPKSLLLMKHRLPDVDKIIEQIGLPAIVKIPDGAFSIGVEKARTAEELQTKMTLMLESSAIILIQEFVPTDFDWRIGVLNEQAFFACRYFMAKGHWQIYNHGARKPYDQSGLADAFAIDQVPKKVIQAAVKAAKCMGDGLFGVDIKQSGERIMVIEVNDNPSIDKGVEDQHLGYKMYQAIMEDFYRRLELANGRSNK